MFIIAIDIYKYIQQENIKLTKLYRYTQKDIFTHQTFRQISEITTTTTKQCRL